MNLYEFTITLSGIGDTPEEAWDQAVESFSLDSGVFDEDDISHAEELDEDFNPYNPPKILINRRRQKHD